MLDEPPKHREYYMRVFRKIGMSIGGTLINKAPEFYNRAALIEQI